ncbi:MAG: DUF302 domain-containing protein [Pseudomonadota bacterium]
MRVILGIATTLVLSATGLAAEEIAPRDGWWVQPTTKDFETLVDAVAEATKANGMAVVTQAGPTGAAAKRGITIPGNRVIGIFNNDFAVKILETSTAAMIEAPVRMYVTENADGTATLSYKMPSHVFAPYADEGGDTLVQLASELDAKFVSIADQAVN